MTKKIPDDVLAAVGEEIAADSREYRETLTDGGEWTKPNKGNSPMLSVRVPAEALAALSSLAEELDVSVSALARGFILDGIAAQDSDDLRAALERLERDLKAVKARALSA